MAEQLPLIVGIGASAGGIPALEGLFGGLPAECGLSFVIVTHLSPDRESLLHQIVGRFTKMSVMVARDGVRLKPGCVYVMPEGAALAIHDGRLQLIDADASHRQRRPVDLFFVSLAEDQHENAVGIVLSGGDGDGTLGVAAIKQAGGITLAQASDGSAPLNPEMPASAIASGQIDFAVPVEQMGPLLMQLAQRLRSFEELVETVPGESEQFRVQAEISRLLRNQTGHDFAGYKNRTFVRRVARRMAVLQIDGFDGYLRQLRHDPSEVMKLFRDLLINVTTFFRDPEAFEALAEKVIPRLLEGRGADDSVRVWVAGCATGEEVYSIAMLLREAMDGIDAVPRVQIFATDIDEEALAIARAARYPEALLKDMDPARMRRFFHRDGASYVIAKELRDMCIFSPHSVISDPPFSRMDLVSCRNLLIYLGVALQDQVIPTFQYALKPGGYLFLGNSEGVSRHVNMFGPIDKKHRIFQSRGRAGHQRRLPMVIDDLMPRSLSTGERRGTADISRGQLRQRVEAQVLEHHAPAHVVVTPEAEILYYSANTGRFLETPRGAPNRQLLDMARRELRLDLRSALRQSIETRGRVSRQVLLVETGGQPGRLVDLTVEPLDGHGNEALFLILFTPLGDPQVAGSQNGGGVTESDLLRASERELRDLRERLQSTVEEYETALEELKSSNEELVSVNEEAQSSNEELEASKEEMQSLNEELTTINAELTVSVEDLDRAHTDLRNLYAATQIASVFLDDQLVVRNFTPAASSFFNLRDADIGRPLTDLASTLDYPELHRHVDQVFRTGELVEHRLMPGSDLRHYLVRVGPYRDRDEQTRGVVITIVDVSTLARAEEQQRLLIAELNHRVKNMLAVVISITNSTLRKSPSPAAFAETLSGRLHGLARAYSLLSESDWTEVSLSDLVAAETRTYGPARLRSQGPVVGVGPDKALALGLIIHELASNAAKFGALTDGAGHVDVTWDRSGDLLTLDWREHGGPAISEPQHNGFGFVLIENQVRHQLKGEIDRSFDAQGFRMQIKFPIDPAGPA